MAVMPQNPRMPKTREAIAIPLVFALGGGNAAGPDITGGGVVAAGAATVANAPANSGKLANAFQSLLPSGRARDCASTRPSAIHWCNCSFVMGPYSRPSPPMILYIEASWLVFARG